MITKNILAVIIITFQIHLAIYLENLPNTGNKQVTNGNILIQIYEWEKEHMTNKKHIDFCGQ